MATSFVRYAEDELSCPICFELFVDPNTPKTLPVCGHVCCEVCLKKMVTEKCARTCPECRNVILMPEGGVSSFPTNFRLRNLAEKHQKIGSTPLPSHTIHKKAGVPICSDHEDEKMHYYCVTCNRLACQACLILKHSGATHNIEGVKEVCKKQKSEMKSIIAQIKSRINEGENILHELKTVETRNTELYKNVEKQIDKCVESRMNEFLEEGQNLKKQFERTKQFHEADFKKQSSTVQEHIDSANTSYQTAVRAAESLPDYEYITQYALLVNKMDEMRITKLKSVAKPTKHEVIKFVPNSSQIKLGHILSVLPEKVRRLKLMQTFDGFNNANRVDSSSDCLLAVTDFNVKKVIIYHKVNGKFEKKLDLKLAPGNQYKPYDVAIHPDGRFMVARSSCIEVYSTQGNHQKNIEIVESDEMKSADRVKVTSDGRILSGGYHKSLITELSPTGNHVRTMHTSIRPHHMSLIHDTHIAISNYKTNQVIVMDIASGQETLRIDIPMVRGICYDEHTECLLIARSEPSDKPGMILLDTGIIEQYSYTTGKLVACLQQGMYHPMGMRMTADDNLIVANNKSINIYEIQ